MSQNQAPAAIQSLIAEAQTREPYKHACKGVYTERVERANTKPYSAFTFRSNARWFEQRTGDGRKVFVTNTMFDPKELAAACTQLAEAGVDRVEIAVFSAEKPVDMPREDAPAAPAAGSETI